MKQPLKMAMNPKLGKNEKMQRVGHTYSKQ